MAWPVSAAFNQALIAPIRDVSMRVTSLDSSFNYQADITGPTVEGVVYVDTTRATRRTAQIRVVNENGDYTPTGPDFANLGTNSIFWWNQLFRLEYGVKVSDDEYEYVPVGTFMVDRVEILAERGVSVINIDGSDLWKKFTFSSFAAPTSYAIGTTYNTIISDLATSAGVTRLNLDPLTERATTEKQVQVPIYFEEGDNRGTKLKELAKAWALDIYFDVNGYLTTRSRTLDDADLAARSPVWEFTTGEDAVFLSLTKSKTGDTIKNHIVVTGEADDGTAVVRAEAINGSGTNVLSGVGVTWKYHTNTFNSTTVQQIGDRVMAIRSKTLRTSQACLDLAKAELLKNVVVEEEVRLPSIVVPQFEGNDVIRIVESLSATDDKYFLQAFDIPMRGSQQEIYVKKVVAI